MTAVQPNPALQEIHLQFSNTFEENRHALEALRAVMTEQGHPGGMGGAWELVLAELLNNVVEHAYAKIENGLVELIVKWTDHDVTAIIIDDGVAMPNGCVPGSADTLADINPEDHPEGGFGWGLIHTLSQSIDYQRESGRNRTRVVVLFDGQ